MACPARVRTRSHKEKDKTPQELDGIERAFFAEHPRTPGIKPKAGLQELSKLLLSTQSILLRDKMPGFISQVWACAWSGSGPSAARVPHCADGPALLPACRHARRPGQATPGQLSAPAAGR